MSDRTATAGGLPATGTARRLPAANVLLGIVFMCTAASLFPVMNGIVKLLGDRYESHQIVWARTLGHLLFVLILFMPRRGFAIFRSAQLGTQIGRSVLLLMSTSLFFFAVHFVPLAKAASISFAAPFLVALMAAALLGERISWPRLAAVIVGFAGVLVVIRPGSEVFQWAAVMILGSAFCYALYQVFTRKVAGHDTPETSVVYSALVGTAIMSLVVPFHWKTPESLNDIALLASLGVFGGLGHYCVAKAMMYAPANIVSPFHYFQMVGSVFVGYVLFQNLPDLWTWIGSAIIVGSGLYIGWRETAEKRAGPAARRP